MTTVFIKPIEGVLVRYPVTMSPLSKDGAEISLDGADGTYWRRRIADGSVIIIDKVIPETESSESTNKTKKGGSFK